MKTFFNGSNPCKNLYCQKCEVAQRPRAANRAEHRSTPHLCQLNIRKRPCRWSILAGTDRNEVGKRCSCRDCLKARLRAGPGSFPRSPGARREQSGSDASGNPRRASVRTLCCSARTGTQPFCRIPLRMEEVGRKLYLLETVSIGCEAKMLAAHRRSSTSESATGPRVFGR